VPLDVPMWEWLAVIAGLLFSAFFSGTETALTSLSEARTRQLVEESGRKNHPLALWLHHPERVITTLLTGNTLANIGLSAVVTDLVMRYGAQYAVAIATGATTFVVLTFCEITPKTLAKRYPVGVSLTVAPIVALLYYLLFPVTYLLQGISAGLLSLAGKRKREATLTGAEIEYLIDLGSRQGVLDEVKKQLLTSVLEFADLLVKDIMVPRTRIVGIEKRASLQETMRVVSESEHSRIPIYEGSVDNIVGILFVKDLVRDLQKGMAPQGFKLEAYVKPSFFVPEPMKISRLLREFQRRKTHMAVVVDEFGGTSGVVTLEDVVEEIVGEIQDETDIEEKALKALPDGRYVADAAAPLRECERTLGVAFPEEGDYETLGGFLTAMSGKVPAVGSVVVWEDLTFLIRGADERRVTKVEISRRKEGAPAAGDGKAATQPREA